LIKISKRELTKQWKALIELDNDEIFYYSPKRRDFLCVEKTEEFNSGRESEGRKWLYELTFSNQSLKEELNMDA
jgi:hypothetical protein